jgi:hypothetical protein
MGTSYNPRIVTDGLVLCLDAANKRSYPGAGNTWTDLTTNKYNGALTNGPTFNSANGGSLIFDGTDDLCRTTLPASELDLDCTVIVTCSVAAVGSIESTANRAFTLDRTSGSTKWTIGTRRETTLFQFAGAGGDDNSTTSYFSYSLNEIFQAAVVVSGSGHRLYKNGNLKSSGSLTGDNSSFSFAAVGCRIIKNDRHWNGKIFNVTAYNRQLTDAEIRQNYLATKGRYQ